MPRREEKPRTQGDTPVSTVDFASTKGAIPRFREDLQAYRAVRYATYAKHDAAPKIKPEILVGWGVALSEWAVQKAGQEADRLFVQAYEMFEAALNIKPDYYEALYNWGITLCNLALQMTDQEADQLFTQACEKFELTLRIKPDTHQALHGWGLALLCCAKHKPGEEADRLLGQSRDKLLAAESISPGSATYYLACISALLGDEAQCRDWLRTSRQHGCLPSREHLASDPDLRTVRECEWFRQLLADLGKPEE